jgi:hypothetical protein
MSLTTTRILRMQMSSRLTRLWSYDAACNTIVVMCPTRALFLHGVGGETTEDEVEVGTAWLDSNNAYQEARLLLLPLCPSAAVIECAC